MPEVYLEAPCTMSRLTLMLLLFKSRTTCCCYSNQERQVSLALRCLGSMCPTNRCFAVPVWLCCLHHCTWLRTNHSGQCEDLPNFHPLSIRYPLQNHRILSERFFLLGNTSYYQWGRNRVKSTALKVLDMSCMHPNSNETKCLFSCMWNDLSRVVAVDSHSRIIPQTDRNTTIKAKLRWQHPT